MPRKIDYTGRKYSHLTFTARAPSRVDSSGASRTWWYTICDCGNTREVEPRQVAAGRVHSCGKCELGRDLAARGRQEFGRRRSLERKGYTQVIEEAGRKGVVFTLMPNIYVGLVHRKCYYCEQPPGTTIQRVVQMVNGVGYTEHNTIAVCPTCYGMRKGLNHAQFLDKCVDITRKYMSDIDEIVKSLPDEVST